MSTTLTTIASNHKPPLTKAEVLKATAVALHRDQIKKRDEYDKAQDKLLKQRDALATAAARKLMNGAEVRVQRYEYDTKFEVRFTVQVDPTAEMDALHKQINYKLRPKVQEVSEIHRRLREATSIGDRTETILRDKKVAEALRDAGYATLNINAIQV